MSIAKKIADKQAKIVALQAEIAELQQQQATVFAATPEVVGKTIAFNYGRGANASQREGVVLGIKSAPKTATILRVQVGTGVDTEIVSVFETQVVVVVEASA